MKPFDRPKRKINAPKRYICNDISEKKNTKNIKHIKHTSCSICDIDIDILNSNKYFEISNKIYCN